MPPDHEDLNCVGLRFGTPEARCLTAVPIKSAAFSVTSIQKNLGGAQTYDVRLPACSAYFLMLYLEDAYHADIAPDGAHTTVRRYESGSICLVDLEDGASICLHSRLCALAFVLPKALVAEAASLSGVAPHPLECRRGKPDIVLGNLGAALLPFFGNRADAPPTALLRHVATAICAHLLHRYGGPLSPREAAREFVDDPAPDASIQRNSSLH